MARAVLKAWRMKGLCLCGLLLFVAGAAGSAAASVNAPVLKWRNGGCFSSWCETGWYSSPAVTDLDGDGKMEVIASSYSIVALDGETGEAKWRVKSGHDRNEPNADNVGRTWPGIVIADVDKDGEIEIVTAHGGGWVSVLNKDGYFDSTGWPWRSSEGGEFRSLSVGDLDGDGDLEIIVGRALGSSKNLWVLEHTGAVRSGWPRLSSQDEGSAWGVYNSNISLGDLDGDGLPEIVAPSDTITICAYKADGSQLPTNPIYHGHSGHDMNLWGETPAYIDLAFEIQGWGPCYEELTPRANFAHGPANVVDVNGDGVKEVVAVGNVHDCNTSPYTNLYNTPFIFNADRSRFNESGFDWTTVPTDTGAPLSEDYNLIENAQANPTTVDLDGDGYMEILFASSDGRMHCLWLDKTEKGSWPYSVHQPAEGLIRFPSEPAVADLDNDGRAEVIFASWTQKGSNAAGKLHILDSLGNKLHEIDLPLGSSDWNGALAAPTLADIDGDGELEAVLNTASSGFTAYDLPGTTNARVLWGTGRGSYFRNGSAAIASTPPGAQGPDLTAAWLQLTITGPSRKGFYGLRGSIIVTNEGSEPADKCTAKLYYPDEAQMILNKPLKVRRLKAGQSATLRFNVKGLSLSAGALLQFTALVDADNVVAESNEGNNKAACAVSMP